MAAESKSQKPFGAADLEQAALSYLNRFDATAKKVSDYLLRLAKKRGGDLATARPLIEELLARYHRSGVIDDRRFARVRAQSLHERGASRRLVALKLAQSGVTREIVEEVLSERAAAAGGSTELDAALAYVRRKRLGRFRAAGEQQAAKRKDLLRLARQGFDFDTAVNALGLGAEDDS